MKWLLFPDLPAPLAPNWTTLNRRIANEGFPPGRLVGRKRVWTEAEILRWLETRPTAKLPPRGRAKRLATQQANACLASGSPQAISPAEPFSALARKRV